MLGDKTGNAPRAPLLPPLSLSSPTHLCIHLQSASQGFQGPWNSAVTSGVLSAMGDLLAQFLNRYYEEVSGMWPIQHVLLKDASKGG